jgi:hypothetical protein
MVPEALISAKEIGTGFVLDVAWSLRGHHLEGDIGCEVRASGRRAGLSPDS